MLDPRRGRGIALSAFALSIAATASACTPPMPPDVLAAQAESQIECQTGSTDVSVPDNLFGAMTFVGDALTSVCPEQTLMEVGPQEPAPLKVVDGTPSSEDVSDFAAGCPAGDVIYVPLYSYPVTLAYNIFGLEGLVLTPDTVAGILRGSITSWEDPAITDANEGFDLSGLPDIEVYTVDQDRGSVQAMTTWLSEEAPQSWSDGTLERLPGNITFGSSFEMSEELAFMEGAVAVLPVFEALNAFVPTAAFPVRYGDDGEEEELIAFPDDPNSQRSDLERWRCRSMIRGTLPLPPRLVASPMTRFSISRRPRSFCKKTSPLSVGPCWEPVTCSYVTTPRTRCPCR